MFKFLKILVSAKTWRQMSDPRMWQSDQKNLVKAKFSHRRYGSPPRNRQQGKGEDRHTMGISTGGLGDEERRFRPFNFQYLDQQILTLPTGQTSESVENEVNL